jgi:crossover junction endodeoxyribonuclease RuvC
MRVLGLDPGSERTGWGCIELDAAGPVRIASGVLVLGRGPLPERLARLDSGLEQVFAQHRPDACATEGLFHHRNARSALLLGHARGVCLLVAARHRVPVAEYAPAAVKRAIAGHGAADKERVCAMVASLLGFEPGELFDETDALAIALCHLEAERPLRLSE